MKEDLVRELMDRAGTDVSGKWMSRDHARVFAELIVRECADYITEYYDSRDEAYYMKKHFGVEE
jgi:Mg/Co/Ni transporter MgtE